MSEVPVSQYEEAVKTAAEFVQQKLGHAEIAIILGSGLGGFVDVIEGSQGHAGKLYAGTVGGKKVFCLAGRIHSYEGYAMHQLTFATKVLAKLGCRLLVATNAAGGAAAGKKPGTVMEPGSIIAIKDHINFVGRNPISDSFGPSLAGAASASSSLYNRYVYETAHTVAKSIDMDLYDGTYSCMPGPTFETPSEVKMGQHFGVASFGMSTVFETTVARICGMETFAFSLCTNLAAGLGEGDLTHEEVGQVAAIAGPRFVDFVAKLIAALNLDLLVQSHRPTDELSPPERVLPPITPTTFSLEPSLSLFESRPSLSLLLEPCFAAFLKDEHVIIDRTVPLSKLHDYPSTAFRQTGTVLQGRRGDRALNIVSGIPPEGLQIEDATYLAHLLAHLGSSSLVHTFSGRAEAEGVALIEDVWSLTTLLPGDRTVIRDQPLLEPATDAENYFHFLGPTQPTPAEQLLANRAGYTIAGTSSPALASLCRSAGWRVWGICGKFTSNRLLVTQPPADLQPLLKLIDAISGPESRVPLARPSHISYNLVPPVVQGDPEQITADAKTLAGHLSVTPTFYVTNFATGLKGATLPFSALGSCCPEGRFVSTDNGLVVEILGTALAGHSFASLVAPIRILAELGARHAFFISAVTSTSDILKPGTVAAVKDHINLSGRHPLTGPNVNQWGTRFPDCSRVYLDAASVVHQAGFRERQIILGFVMALQGRLFKSRALSTYVSQAGLIEALTTSAIPQVLTARHHDLRIAQIALVVDTLLTGHESSVEEHFHKVFAAASHFVWPEKMDKPAEDGHH